MRELGLDRRQESVIASLLVLLALGLPVGFALWLTGLTAVVIFKVTSFTQIAQSLFIACL